MKLPTGPDETPTYLYNPTKEDFIAKWGGKEYTLPSRKIVKFPKWLADHLAKTLARKLTVEENSSLHFEERLELNTSKIYIEL